jgi:hypothetical protein
MEIEPTGEGEGRKAKGKGRLADYDQQGPVGDVAGPDREADDLETRRRGTGTFAASSVARRTARDRTPSPTIVEGTSKRHGSPPTSPSSEQLDGPPPILDTGYECEIPRSSVPLDARDPSTTRSSTPTNVMSHLHHPLPSSLAPPVHSSSFLAPSPTSRPSLCRQHSMPASSRRSRATSYSPSARPLGSPGPSSLSARGLDPDQHWLSEDEATGSGEGSSRRQGRQCTLRRRADGGGDGSSTEGNVTPIGKARGDLAAFGSTTHSSHPIHHRPSTSSTLVSPDTATLRPSPPFSPNDRPLSHVIPILISLLTCPTCHRLFHDPTTLGCGHSVCISCALSVALRPPELPHARATSPGVLSIEESRFARNPITPFHATGMTRSSSAGSFVSSLLSRSNSTMSTATTPDEPLLPRSSSYRGRANCPHRDCRALKDRVGVVAEAKVDFGLQKVLGLLRSAIPGIDREVERVRCEEEALGNGDAGWVGDGETGHTSRSNSGSSAGGGEDPQNDDESKRVHRTREWKSSKRRKRPSSQDGTPIVGRLSIDYDHVSSTFLNDVLSELECQICVQLLHDPVTSPCGHTFCQKCLARAYDHSDTCPLCRADFPSFARFQSQPINSTLQSLVLSVFPTHSADRLASLQAEERSNPLDTPLFVCTLAWPNLPTYIHVFEPRYRLMIRRAMESNRQFGMVLPCREPQGRINEYGTMLYIQSCHLIEDGRSIVETTGTYRFKIVERGTLDGYTVGRIERVDDISQAHEDELERRALASNPVEGAGTPSTGSSPATIERSTSQLMQICLDFVQRLRSGSAPWVLQRLNNTSLPSSFCLISSIC